MSIAIVIAILIAVVATLLILGPESSDERLVQSVLQKRQFISSKHKWENSETKGIYFCALCLKLMVGFWSKILECKKCGILVHQYCKLTNLKKPDCKYIIAGKNRPAKTIHQWRQSIHSISSICSYCESVCTGFEAYMCLWCHRMKHSNCKDEGQCDLGSLKNMVISPNQIFCDGVFFAGNIFRTLSKKNKDIKEKISDDSEIEPNTDITFNFTDKTKSPVIVLVNKKSGGQAGNEYLKNFYMLLNPLQVISILDEGLDRLKIFQHIKNLRIVVGGGDGTVCSVLNYLTSGAVEHWKSNNPPVAVFPLGTGNDLSRALGWGSGNDDRDAKMYLQDFDKKGRTIKIDRWLLTISNPEIGQHGEGQKVYTVYNYLGIGLDAQVCYDFHKVREKYPGLFVSPFSNKLIYTQMGAYDFLVTNRSVLIKNYVSVQVDGNMIELSGLENLVLLNINHWAGGVSGLWKATGNFKPSCMNDGVLEVLGVSDMLHLGQIQIGMEVPLQISQGKVVIVRSIANCTMSFQIDGQPFQLKAPFVLKVQYKDKVNLYATCQPTPDEKFRRIISDALASSVIDQEQYQYFMEKLES